MGVCQRRSPLAGAFLDGLNVAALALMVVVTKQLALTALVDWLTIVLALVSVVLLVRFRPNSMWLVLGGAVIGLGASVLGINSQYSSSSPLQVS